MDSTTFIAIYSVIWISVLIIGLASLHKRVIAIEKHLGLQ